MSKKAKVKRKNFDFITFLSIFAEKYDKTSQKMIAKIICSLLKL